MKKILLGAFFAMLFMVASPVSAAAGWTLNAPKNLTFGCGAPYSHTLLTVSQDSEGNLTGTGRYDTDNSYTWDLTGNITGSNVTMNILYTGASAGAEYNLVGTISVDGSISGTSDSNCQTFTMPAGSATVISVANVPENKDACKKGGWENLEDADGNQFKNQGQCVSYVNHLNNPEVTTTATFTATDSVYYNCSTVCSNIYATGPLSITWDTATGVVSSGYYNEVIGSTTYFNVVDYGSVSGGNVNLTFSRTIPDVHVPFNFVGTLSGGVLSGQLDGPYLLTATGVVTP